MFFHRKKVGKRLARVGHVGEAVDDRAGGVLGNLFDGFMLFAAHDDDVDKLAEDLGEVVDPFAFAETDIFAEHDAAAAEVGHAGLEAYACAERLFFEEQRHHATRQQGLADALREFGFEVFGQREDAEDFVARDVVESD